MSYEVIHGDCLDALRALPDASVDAVVTDPPYGVGLKYKSFDDTREAIAALARQWLPEARRVAKIVAFTPGKGNEWLYPEPTWQLGWAMKTGSVNKNNVPGNVEIMRNEKIKILKKKWEA